MSKRAVLANTCLNGEAVMAGIKAVLPDVQASARSLFHLLCKTLYLSLTE